MKSYDVTIQMKPLEQYFHVVLFIFQHVTRNLEILVRSNFWPFLGVKG